MNQTVKSLPELDANRIADAAERVRHALLAERIAAGHWVGQLSSSALATATAISAMSFYLDADGVSQRRQIEQQVLSGLAWLATEQNDDGGWGDTDLSYSNIATTMLVIAAIHASEQTARFSGQLERANSYVETKGGIEGIRKRYGKDKTFAVPILANCAMAGIVPWKEVSALPFEAACVPQRFYHLMQMPVVSYAVPALVAIGQVKFKLDPPRNPVTRFIRSRCVRRSLDVLNKMQPASGGYLEAVPLTSFVSMALIKAGRSDHLVVENGIRFLLESFRETGQGQGTWPIDTNLATWTTTLSVNALFDTGDSLEDLNDAEWESCRDWILSCQYREVHPFTGSAPGGWGWSDLSGAVPDADDTPGALLALKHFYDVNFDGQSNFDTALQARIIESAKLGVRWLLDLQNRDSGWPTFCRGWGKLPFDRSGTDITAHAMRSLYVWQQTGLLDEKTNSQITRAMDSGFRYLSKHQNSDGSWFPLWFGNQDRENEVNPYYGTAKVLMAYRDTGRFDTNSATIGLNWLSVNQNLDGGWGGGDAIASAHAPVTSSVEETALCTEVLLDASRFDSRFSESARLGVNWLCDLVEDNAIDRVSPIGFYFAKLWYHEKLYPLIFATSALTRASKFANVLNSQD